jgi:hypothetical protein
MEERADDEYIEEWVDEWRKEYEYVERRVD